MNILLVKPKYKTNAPPLSLMKISTYHKQKRDNVEYIEGIVKTDKKYDKIYITSLFSWDIEKVLNTVNYYKYKSDDITLGGHITTFFPLQELRRKIWIRPVKFHVGLWEEIEGIKPDYTLFPNLDYSIVIATRGCIRKCGFCGVSKLEPNYIDYIPITPQVDNSKSHIQLWGNNDFASSKFETIINELINLGFYKDAKFNKKQRWVDFNQGTDCRLFNKDLAQLISKININPLRFAFDGMQEDGYYQDAIRLAVKYDIKYFSSYILYNYNDTPEDFYYRCRTVVELNEKLGLRISGFPMKYIPINAKDKSYVGKHWTKEKLRIVQLMKNPCLGKLPVKLETFNKLWGKDVNEFLRLLELKEEEFYRHLD